jgi:hypothetical protein
MGRRINVGVALAFSLLAARAPLAEEARIRVGGGSVSVPGEKWIVESEPDASAVRFTRRYAWLGQTKGSTQIVVFRNAVAPEGGDDTAAIAAAFFAGEERIMRESGVAAGDYELSGVERGTRVVGERTLHTFAYRKQLATRRFGRKVEQSLLCVWFPEGFPVPREFYGFLISELREKGALVEKPDLAQIDRVIEGFRLEAGTP